MRRADQTVSVSSPKSEDVQLRTTFKDHTTEATSGIWTVTMALSLQTGIQQVIAHIPHSKSTLQHVAGETILLRRTVEVLQLTFPSILWFLVF